jgi:hypothetical protein
LTHSIPSHAALHAISRACDLAMARPFGHAQRVARAALHLGRAPLPPPTPLLADLLIAALCHAAGAVAVAGDLGRVLQRDERPTLRHTPPSSPSRSSTTPPTPAMIARTAQGYS